MTKQATAKSAARTQDEVSFDVTPADRALITKIVARAKDLGLLNRNYSGLTLSMDIAATHANGCPLKLAALLAADDFNFMHDVCGIARHIDRNTAQLLNHFSPRFHGLKTNQPNQKGERHASGSVRVGGRLPH